MPIGVIILIKPIEEVKPILNCILTLPYIKVFRCILMNFQNARNWLYLAVERFKAPISIIIPKNLFNVYRMVILQVKGSQLREDRLVILSTAIIKCIKALLANLVVIEAALFQVVQLKKVKYWQISYLISQSVILSLELISIVTA